MQYLNFFEWLVFGFFFPSCGFFQWHPVQGALTARLWELVARGAGASGLGGGIAHPNGVSPAVGGDHGHRQDVTAWHGSTGCPLRPWGSPRARQCRRLGHPGAGKGWGLPMPLCFYHLEIVSYSATNRIFVSLLSASAPSAPLTLAPTLRTHPQPRASQDPLPRAGEHHTRSQRGHIHGKGTKGPHGTRPGPEQPCWAPHCQGAAKRGGSVCAPPRAQGQRGVWVQHRTPDGDGMGRVPVQVPQATSPPCTAKLLAPSAITAWTEQELPQGAGR